MILAPVIVFAFNRPDTLQNTLSSLHRNELAKDTDLFVFVDGPRNDSDAVKIAKVRSVLEALDGFRNITVEYAERNKGLARSVIEGTTKIVNQYGRVIVVEDDLYVADSFLSYMNGMLDRYEGDERVFQVSGFSVKVKRPAGYQSDVYLDTRAHSWTWGTWKNRWETVDWAVKDYGLLRRSIKKQMAFNRLGSDLYGMLRGYMEGKNNSWAIRFTYSMYKQQKYCVAPLKSLVINNGFRKESTNCKAYNRYKVDFWKDSDGVFNAPQFLQPHDRILKETRKYWSIPYRIYGKLATYVLRVKWLVLRGD